MVLCGTPHEEIKEYALCTLAHDEEDYTRGLAFQYIQQFFPALIPALVEQYQADQSPRIRYHIAWSLPDRQQRIDALRSILPDVGYDHELGDAILLEIGYGKIEKTSEPPQKDEATRALMNELGQL